MAYLARAAARSERLRGIVTGERADVSDRDFLRGVELVSSFAGEGYGKVSEGESNATIRVIVERVAAPAITAAARLAPSNEVASAELSPDEAP